MDKVMVMEKISEQIERFKLRAELFLKENTKAFIIDARDDWHFCHISEVNENNIKVIEFTGKLKGQENFINWIDIIKFEEFRERER